MTTLSNVLINIERTEREIASGMHNESHNSILKDRLDNYRKQRDHLQSSTYTLRDQSSKGYFKSMNIKREELIFTMLEAEATRLSAEEAHKMRFKLSEQNINCEENFASDSLSFEAFCKTL